MVHLLEHARTRSKTMLLLMQALPPPLPLVLLLRPQRMARTQRRLRNASTST
jgi:hypothetical protein